LPLSIGSVSNNSREHNPTIFEAYRKVFGLPGNETWIISGKNQLSTCDYSIHPSWGDEYGANLEFGVGRGDIETMQRFYAVAAADRPSLALINLRDVDSKGHFGTFEEYLDAIMIADSLAYDLWQNIQSVPFYSDRTLLIVTTDHGRNPRNVAFHGGPDHSNRHLLFLALGPDVHSGKEVTTRRILIDLTSTVGEVLGFDMPYSEGEILHEMFVSVSSGHPGYPGSAILDGESRLTNSSGFSINPHIELDSEGLHVVWSERDTTKDEEQRYILYRNSTDSGNSWSDPDTLFDDFTFYKEFFPSGIAGATGWVDDEGSFAIKDGFELIRGGTPVSASIYSVDDGDLVVAANGYSVLSFMNKKELLWGVNLVRKGSEGEWVEQGFDNIGHLVANAPELTSYDSEPWATWTDGGGRLSLGKAAEGKKIVHRFGSLPELREYGYYYRTPVLEFNNGSIHLVFDLHTKDIGSIIYMKATWPDLEFGSLVSIDDGARPSICPRLAASGDELYIVWSEYKQKMWQVKFIKSTDNGDSFGEIQHISSSSAGAWNPDIAVDNESIVVVWEDYRDGNGEIYFTASTDGAESWGSETRLSDSDSFSSYPRITGRDGTFYAVWQDYSDGNWEIYFKDFTINTN
jgi:hypothetical protein